MSGTTTATELWRMSATDLAETIRSKQASSQEVIEAHLRRIEAVNPSVNAVTVVLDEQAVEAAKVFGRRAGLLRTPATPSRRSSRRRSTRRRRPGSTFSAPTCGRR